MFLWDLGKQKVKFGSKKAIFGVIWFFLGVLTFFGNQPPHPPTIRKDLPKKRFFYSFPYCQFFFKRKSKWNWTNLGWLINICLKEVEVIVHKGMGGSRPNMTEHGSFNTEVIPWINSNTCWVYAPVSKKNDFSSLSFELYNLEKEITRTRKNKKE